MMCIRMKDFQTVLFCIRMNSFSIYVNTAQLEKTQYPALKNYDKGILLQSGLVFRTLPIFLASFILQSVSQTKTLTIYQNILLHGEARCLEFCNCSDSQKIPRILYNSTVHYRVHYSPHILSRLNPVRSRVQKFPA